jgi:hypothetical protein
MIFPEDLSSFLLEALVLKIKGNACFPFALFVHLSPCNMSRTAERGLIKFYGGKFY